MRYSAESTILPTNARDLLEWAADHIEALGFHDGRDGSQFGHNCTTTRLRTPGMIGALDVAGGDGRYAASRTYDYDALYAAKRLALDTLADLAAGGAVAHHPVWNDEYRHRRCVIHDWGTQDGRTGADAAALFREAAGLVEDAAAAAIRPGRPPLRLHLPTAGDVLEWAAAHIEDAGHRPGIESHDPAGFAATAACTMLHALDRALVAAKPNPGDAPKAWEAYRAAEDALELLTTHLAGAPVDLIEGESEWALRRRRRFVILSWGNQPGRTAGEVVAAFRSAAPVFDVDAAGDLEEPTEPGQAAFF